MASGGFSSCRVLVAALGLSLVWRAEASLVAVCRLLSLWSAGSRTRRTPVVAAHGLSKCYLGLVAPQHVGS